MAANQSAEPGIRYEAKIGKVGVYVLVVMAGECPAEVQVSVADISQELSSETLQARRELGKLAGLANEWLASGMPKDGLIRFCLLRRIGIAG